MDPANNGGFTAPVRMTLLGLAILGALAVGACLPATQPTGGDPVIDTWPVGAVSECSQPGKCDELVRVGLAGLDERNPGHAPVVSARVHLEGSFVDPTTGDTILMIRSGGCCQVLVVELADGTIRAIGVGYPGISDKAVAIPWEGRPGR